MIYKLIVPIEIGQDTIETITLHKPTLGELTKVRAEDPYSKALEMLVACSDRSKIELSRLSFEDTTAITEVMADFLGFSEKE